MTANPQHLPVPQSRALQVRPISRALALRPALALVASRALPAVTASVAAAATVLTAERAVRGVTRKLTPTRPEPTPAITSAVMGTTRTVVTEWLTIERRKRAS
jgi:hypothetical protein